MSAAADLLRRRWRQLAAAAIAVVLVLGVAAAVTWHFSSAVLVPDHWAGLQDVAVETSEPGRVVLSRDEDTERPGVYGLEWQGGHAIAGAVTKRRRSVTRRL